MKRKTVAVSVLFGAGIGLFLTACASTYEYSEADITLYRTQFGKFYSFSQGAGACIGAKDSPTIPQEAKLEAEAAWRIAYLKLLRMKEGLPLCDGATEAFVEMFFAKQTDNFFRIRQEAGLESGFAEKSLTVKQAYMDALARYIQAKQNVRSNADFMKMTDAVLEKNAITARTLADLLSAETGRTIKLDPCFPQ